METQAKRLRKYSGIALGTVLVMAFVLANPVLNQAYGVAVEGLPSLDPDFSCGFTQDAQPDDPTSMNTVRKGSIVKTIHAEQHVFDCKLDQGGLDVQVEITIYIEIYENIDNREVISASALVATCLKEPSIGGEDPPGGATVIDCESSIASSDAVPVFKQCAETTYITHPQEMDTVNKGNIAKTIEAQKEVIRCVDGDTTKVIDVVLFTEIYQNLSTQTVEEVQFHVMRCVIDRDIASVESCRFSTIQN